MTDRKDECEQVARRRRAQSERCYAVSAKEAQRREIEEMMYRHRCLCNEEAIHERRKRDAEERAEMIGLIGTAQDALASLQRFIEDSEFDTWEDYDDYQPWCDWSGLRNTLADLEKDVLSLEKRRGNDQTR